MITSHAVMYLWSRQKELCLVVAKSSFKVNNEQGGVLSYPYWGAEHREVEISSLQAVFSAGGHGTFSLHTEIFQIWVFLKKKLNYLKYKKIWRKKMKLTTKILKQIIKEELVK